MEKKYEIDSYDQQILSRLQQDARTPYLEIARDLGVSGGTIHQRVDRLKAAGVITGSCIQIDESKLGYGVTTLVGIHLSRAQDYPDLVSKLLKMHEVIEAHYTTGTYAIFAKIVVHDMKELYETMTNKIQKIPGVRSTESFISLKTPINRQINLNQ